MPVTHMEKLTVIALQSDIDTLLTELAALRAVEILQGSALDEDGCLLPPLSVDSATAAAAAARIDRLLPVFIARSPRHARVRRTPLPIDAAEFTRTGAKERALKTADEAERLLAYIEETTKARLAEEEEMAALLPYLSHTFPLDDAGTKTTTFLLGCLPAGTATEDIEKAANAAGFVFEILSADKNGVYLATVLHRAMREAVETALSELGFTPAKWRDTRGRATALFDAASAHAAALDEEIARANAQLDTLAENLADLKILSDILRVEAKLAAYREKAQELDSCAVLTAWCPAHERVRLTALLDELDVAYSFAPPTDGEKVPVLAETPPTAGKLAPLLDTYTHPHIAGRSTALPLLLLYLLSFGFLFADVGYGLLTALLFFPIARFLAVEKRSKHAFYTLGACGLAAIPFGILQGNYFGAWLAQAIGVPSLVPFAALSAWLTDVRALFCTPRGFLPVAFTPAALVLLITLTLRVISVARGGKPLDAIIAILPELFTLTGLGLLPFFPFIGLGITAAGLLITALLACKGQPGTGNKLTLYGGALLNLLVALAEGLQAARIALIGVALLPIARLISLLPLAHGEVLIWYFGMLLVFLAAHLLGVLLNLLVTLARRARLAYMARHETHYPGRDCLFAPMHLPRKYTMAIPTYLPADAAEGEAEDTDIPPTFTTEKSERDAHHDRTE
ncbi:MAG: hypothetical protein IJC99_05415 [Clostridia bacterium]|nr:hypothetical protein [Clostridia bacterium]